MKLKRVAQWANWEQFEEWDGSAWVPGVKGRFAPVDRFLSNFNKPLRRRMLFTDPESALPASHVVRNPKDGMVYILGQSRTDNDGVENYQRLTVCHMASGNSSGFLQIRRKSANGPADDPGWLVESVVASVYGDFELRGSVEADGSNNEFYGTYFLHLPAGTGAKSDDYVTFSGVEYRLDVVYQDSGFELVRVSQRRDPRENIVVSVPGSKQFQVSNSKVTSTDRDFQITAVVKHSSDVRDVKSADSSDYLLVYVDEPDIGFTPKPGLKLEYLGTAYECKQITRDAENSQFKLRFE